MFILSLHSIEILAKTRIIFLEKYKKSWVTNSMFAFLAMPMTYSCLSKETFGFSLKITTQVARKARALGLDMKTPWAFPLLIALC